MALAEIKSELAQSSPAPQKSKAAFRTIAEVAAALQVEAHVLRFWESKFSNIKPTKLRGGRRYYRPQDIEIIKTIKELLYDRGYTIRGVQKILAKKGAWSEMQSGLAADIAAHGVMAQNSGGAIAATHITEPQIPVPANGVQPVGHNDTEVAAKIREAVDQNTAQLNESYGVQITSLEQQLKDTQSRLQSAESKVQSLQQAIQATVNEWQQSKDLLRRP